MSWFSDIASHAEKLLDKIDQGAAEALRSEKTIDTYKLLDNALNAIANVSGAADGHDEEIIQESAPLVSIDESRGRISESQPRFEPEQQENGFNNTSNGASNRDHLEDSSFRSTLETFKGDGDSRTSNHLTENEHTMYTPGPSKPHYVKPLLDLDGDDRNADAPPPPPVMAMNSKHSRRNKSWSNFGNNRFASLDTSRSIFRPPSAPAVKPEHISVPGQSTAHSTPSQLPEPSPDPSPTPSPAPTLEKLTPSPVIATPAAITTPLPPSTSISMPLPALNKTAKPMAALRSQVNNNSNDANTGKANHFTVTIGTPPVNRSPDTTSSFRATTSRPYFRNRPPPDDLSEYLHAKLMQAHIKLNSLRIRVGYLFPRSYLKYMIIFYLILMHILVIYVLFYRSAPTEEFASHKSNVDKKTLEFSASRVGL